MFRHSVVALAYFDEDGDRLQRRKDQNQSYLLRMNVEVLTGQMVSKTGNVNQMTIYKLTYFSQNQIAVLYINC